MSFPAKFAGTCIAPDCLISPATKAVVVGQQIIWSRHERGKVYHAECYQAMKGLPTTANRDDEANEPEDMATGPIPAPKAIPQSTTLPSDGIAATLATAIAPYLESKLSAKMDESQVARVVDARLAGIKPMVESVVLDAISTLQQPTRIEVHNISTNTTRDIGLQHKQFRELLTLVQTVPNIWLTGAAGTGKTTAAESVAKALEIPFYFTGAIAEPYSLLGFKNAHGEYQRTAFREAYENGGVFLFDEIDSSDPLAVMPFNAALANGHCAFPDGVIARHPNCRIIAAANTWGHGANDSYVGRMKVDGSFLDRFVKLPWEIDESLEETVASNIAWVRRVRSIRAQVQAKGIRVLVTPRASINGARLLAAGLPMERVEELCIRNGMTTEQWNSVRG